MNSKSINQINHINTSSQKPQKKLRAMVLSP